MSALLVLVAALARMTMEEDLRMLLENSSEDSS